VIESLPSAEVTLEARNVWVEGDARPCRQPIDSLTDLDDCPDNLVSRNDGILTIVLTQVDVKIRAAKPSPRHLDDHFSTLRTWLSHVSHGHLPRTLNNNCLHQQVLLAGHL
jgi:hypothetical protein